MEEDRGKNRGKKRLDGKEFEFRTNLEWIGRRSLIYHPTHASIENRQ